MPIETIYQHLPLSLCAYEAKSAPRHTYLLAKEMALELVGTFQPCMDFPHTEKIFLFFGFFFSLSFFRDVAFLGLRD